MDEERYTKERRLRYSKEKNENEKWEKREIEEEEKDKEEDRLLLLFSQSHTAPTPALQYTKLARVDNPQLTVTTTILHSSCDVPWIAWGRDS